MKANSLFETDQMSGALYYKILEDYANDLEVDLACIMAAGIDKDQIELVYKYNTFVPDIQFKEI
jgi:hypothetical protein